MTTRRRQPPMGIRGSAGYSTDSRSTRARASLAVALLALLAAGAVRAAETEWWVTDSASDLVKAESRGVLVDPDGVVSVGPALREWKSDSIGVIWAIAPLADGSIAVAGDRGRVDRWTEKDGLRPWASLGTGQVLALA